MRPLFTRIRIRSTGNHGRNAPPLPPASQRCKATTRTGQRCRLDAGPDGYCGQWGHVPPPPGPLVVA
jgi:hypothetical protein